MLTLIRVETFIEHKLVEISQNYALQCRCLNCTLPEVKFCVENEKIEKNYQNDQNDQNDKMTKMTKWPKWPKWSWWPRCWTCWACWTCRTCITCITCIFWFGLAWQFYYYFFIFFRGIIESSLPSKTWRQTSTIARYCKSKDGRPRVLFSEYRG